MAGSGITRTKRAGDFFCGSCTGAVLAAIDKNYPFDKIIAVEKNQNKAKALKARLKKINPQLSVDVYDKSLSKVKSIIASELKQDCISCIVIDSEGFQGLTCGSINPLILTWFEYDLGRMRSAALGIGSNAKETGDRLTELLGSDIWKDANDSEITEAFIKRVREETNKSALSIDIMDLKRKHYKMILFTEVPHITKKWKEAIEKRLGSDKGLSIAKLLDVRSGRQSDLSKFL